MVTIGLTQVGGPEGAPMVVLAHSLGAGPLIWEKVVPALQQNYRPSLLTLPGHGQVPVPTAPFTMDELADSTARAIREIDPGPVLFAGVSIGGALAFTLALRHPDLLAGVVPIAAIGAMGGAEHWAARARDVRENSTASLVDGSTERWFAPSSLEREPELVGRILRVLAQTPAEGYARCAEALGTYDVEADVGSIAVPMLLLAGQHDPIAPAEKVEALAGRIPGARYELIEEAAHQPPAEQADGVAGVLLEFFEAVTPGGA